MSRPERMEEEPAAEPPAAAASAAPMPAPPTSDLFRCARCNQRRVTYFQMQTRSADDPMTTFITCTNCGNRWKALPPPPTIPSINFP